jgi:hypothetical protein
MLMAFALAVLVIAASTLEACSVDSKGFGDVDAGAGGKGQGGAVGGGGSKASGGTVGSGGAVGTGGTEASGGRAGTGGVGVGSGGLGEGSGGSGAGGGPGGSGADGGKGAGADGGKGSGAAGGKATGGGPGGSSTGGTGAEGGSSVGGKDGGSGGQAGDKKHCDMLVSDYANALPEARACTPGAPMQCKQTAPTSLSSCFDCPTYVNDATKLTQIRAQWQMLGCNNPVGLCPAIACVLPGVAVCAPTDASSPGGECTGSLLTPAN